MAYDQYLEERISKIFAQKKILTELKRMMGGLCYMVDGKMCVGIVRDELMARIGPAAYDEALKKTGCKEMTFTGRRMKGFVFVDADGYDMEEDLEYWIQKCIDYNPIAKASKKKKKKS